MIMEKLVILQKYKELQNYYEQLYNKKLDNLNPTQTESSKD